MLLYLEYMSVAFVTRPMKIEHVSTHRLSSVVSYLYLHQNSQTVKKGAAHAKKNSSMKKVVKSKVAAQKWLWWSDNGKNF